MDVSVLNALRHYRIERLVVGIAVFHAENVLNAFRHYRIERQSLDAVRHGEL